jgi:DNA-3-methyladenine glycosylase II
MQRRVQTPVTGAPRALTRQALHGAAGELALRDPILAGIRERLGTPPMWGRRPGFATLVKIILEQQVSLAAARTLYRRLEAHLGGVTPDRVAASRVEGLREFGLTRQKAAYCHGLALRVQDGSLDLSAAARAHDAAGRSALLAVPGLGPWSVDIYYLMALRRPDVWPTGDLALAASIRDLRRMRRLPTADEQHRLARRWAPWRSVAARMLWAHYLEARGQYSPDQAT